MANSQEILAKNLAELLESNRLSQKDFAKAADLDQTGIGKYLKGKLAVGTRVLEKMAAALGVPAFYLIMPPEERKAWDNLKGTNSQSTTPAMPNTQDGFSSREKLMAAVMSMSQEDARVALQLIGTLTDKTPDQLLAEADALLDEEPHHSPKRKLP